MCVPAATFRGTSGSRLSCWGGRQTDISSSCQSNLAVLNAVIWRGQGESNFPEGHSRKVPPSNSDHISRQRMNLLTTEH